MGNLHLQVYWFQDILANLLDDKYMNNKDLAILLLITRHIFESTLIFILCCFTELKKKDIRTRIMYVALAALINVAWIILPERNAPSSP